MHNPHSIVHLPFSKLVHALFFLESFGVDWSIPVVCTLKCANFPGSCWWAQLHRLLHWLQHRQHSSAQAPLLWRCCKLSCQSLVIFFARDATCNLVCLLACVTCFQPSTTTVPQVHRQRNQGTNATLFFHKGLCGLLSSMSFILFLHVWLHVCHTASLIQGSTCSWNRDPGHCEKKCMLFKMQENHKTSTNLPMQHAQFVHSRL